MRERGFTLYELTMTVLLIMVILSIAVPSFARITARQQQRAESSALFNAIHLARKESIMRRTVVSLCPTTNGTQCDDGRDWSFGWLMFENADRDSPPRVDAGEKILANHRVGDNVRITANRKGFTLRATFLRATNGTLVICDRLEHIPPKGLVVSYTGRPRVADRTSAGRPYRCAD